VTLHIVVKLFTNISEEGATSLGLRRAQYVEIKAVDSSKTSVKFYHTYGVLFPSMSISV